MELTDWLKRTSAEESAREAAGLDWLRGASGGVRVVRVLGLDGAVLRLERVEPARPDTAAARSFGAALARTHAAGAPGWGAPPHGTTGDGFLGATVLPTPDEPPASWGDFYASHRVLPYLQLAVDAGALDRQAAAVVERCATRLAAGGLDVDQPALVGDGAARLHGDLWSGNLLWTSGAGGRVEAVLIDPAAHGGHAETDLAMLALFGAPHLDEIRAGYTEVSPLAEGWQQRVGLHQLHPLLVHAALFGGGYGAQAADVARRWS